MDPSKEPDKERPILGPNNIGIQIIEMGEDDGIEDLTRRPLRESLRKRIKPEDLPPEATDKNGESK